MYINGVQVATGTRASTANRTPPAGTGEFYIGRANWNDPYPNMMLRDFRIYSRALDTEELAEMYKDFLLAYLRINDVYNYGDMLPETLLGLPATWTASDGVSVLGGMVMAGTEPKLVTVTASFGTYSKSFQILIVPLNYWNQPVPTVTLPKSLLGNPVTRSGFIGDPAAVVVDDTVWLIGGQDMGSTGYNIPRYVAYSSKDLINWESHGVVLDTANVPWQGTVDAWAAQMIPYGGKYYLYTCGWGRGTYGGSTHIGVAVADQPQGPYVDIGQPLVRSTVTTDRTSDFNDIDPTVWVETVEGVEHRYLAWGNNKFYICELNEDMISVKDRDGVDGITFGTAVNSDIREMLAGNTNFVNRGRGAGVTEAPWFYKRGGIYYVFFAGGFNEDLSYARAQNIFGP
jgi:hypothetical protein